MKRGLSAVGLSDTPELNTIIDAMNDGDVELLALTPSESQGFITSTSLWGTVLVFVSNKSTNNRNAFVAITSQSLEYGGYWNGELRRWSI